MTRSQTSIEMVTKASSQQLIKLFNEMQLNSDEIDSADIVQQWLEKHDFRLNSRIAADRSCFKAEDTISVFCPSSSIRFEVELGNSATLDEALTTAKNAQNKWTSLEPEEKVKALYKLARSYERHAKLFGTAEAVCYSRKRFEQCRDASVRFAIEYLYSAAANKNFHHERASFESIVIVQHDQNSPVNLIAEWRLGEALANDCPLVLVVTPNRCLPALVFSEICIAANLPDGLFSVVIMNCEQVAEIQSPSPKVYLLPLLAAEPHLSTSIIADRADLQSAVDGAFEMLADCWGTSNYFGVMLYIQDCLHDKVMKILRERLTHVKTQANNFAKTIDIVSKTEVRVVKATQVVLDDDVRAQPTIYVQGFKTIKEASSLVSTGPLHSDCLSIWSEDVDVALEISDRLCGYRNIWVNGQHFFDSDIKCLDWLLCCSGEYDPSANVGHAQSALIDASEEHQCSGSVDQTYMLYYGGVKKPADSNTYYPVHNRYPPFDKDNKVLGYVPAGGPKDVRNAVEAAAKAFPGWSKLSPLQRSKYMFQLADGLSKYSEGLHRKLALNTSHSDCEQELENCVRTAFRWAGCCGTNSKSATSPTGVKVFSSYQPHGVIGILCPPIRVMESLISMITGAISNGNTVVVIVPEDYPLAPLTLVQVIEHCALPPGVINLLAGPTEKLIVSLAEHHEVSSLWCWANWKLPSVVQACVLSKKRSVWWFNQSTERPNLWLEKELTFHRAYKKNVWLPCSSIFAN